MKDRYNRKKSGECNMSQTQLSSRFNKFAAESKALNSRLYEFLSYEVAKDDQLLELSSHAQTGQPVPNLLFASIHYLLLKGFEHPLREFYPSISKTPKVVEESFVDFKDFCAVYREDILSLLRSKLVQTNEIRRCAYLYPIFCWIYNETKKPLSLIEIGTSAGLQLLWDHCSYSYGDEKIYGEKSSNIHLTAQVKGNQKPFLLNESPPVSSKVGVDLHVNRLMNQEDALWLKALIWPEHKERRDLFDRAVALYRENPVELIEGDGISLLPKIVKDIPDSSTICIFHTHVANQIPEDLKHQLLVNIDSLGKERNIFHIYNNMWDEQLHLDYIMQGVTYKYTIGET